MVARSDMAATEKRHAVRHNLLIADLPVDTDRHLRQPKADYHNHRTVTTGGSKR